MPKTTTHISILLDRSGSMEPIARETIGAMNSFLDDQRRVAGDAAVTIIQFDSQEPFDIVLDRVNLRKIRGLDPNRYQPRGFTPLLDAIGLLIGHIDHGIAARADDGKPIEDQLVLIVTDGLENASTEYTAADIRRMIQTRRSRAWTFHYLGANQDAVLEASKVGIPPDNALRWDATAAGSRVLWTELSRATTNHRRRHHQGGRTRSATRT